MDQIIKTGLNDFLEQSGIVLSDKQINQFLKYYDLLNQWNQVMNLTTIIEPEEVVVKHFADSLTLAYVIHDMGEKVYKMIDVGTGAGFPGIPLKIVYPGIRLTLLDSLNKRVRFLQKVCEDLKLDEVQTIHGRAEEYGKKIEYREQYDICVSRAVSNLATLSEYCLPFVRVGGYFVSYKSEKAEEELENSKFAVKILGGKIDEVKEFLLERTKAKRVLIKIKKEYSTGKKYPRKAGLPAKEPLVK